MPVIQALTADPSSKLASLVDAVWPLLLHTTDNTPTTLTKQQVGWGKGGLQGSGKAAHVDCVLFVRCERMFEAVNSINQASNARLHCFGPHTIAQNQPANQLTNQPTRMHSCSPHTTPHSTPQIHDNRCLMQLAMPRNKSLSLWRLLMALRGGNAGAAAAVWVMTAVQVVAAAA